MPESPEASREQKIAFYLQPLQELLSAKIFERHGGSTTYYVTVKWKEPREGSAWEPFSATGKLDERFLNWAKEHYEHWVDRAHVPLNVEKIETLAQGLKETPSW